MQSFTSVPSIDSDYSAMLNVNEPHPTDRDYIPISDHGLYGQLDASLSIWNLDLTGFIL